MATSHHHSRFGADGYAWDSSREALDAEYRLAQGKLEQAGVDLATCALVEPQVWVTTSGELWSTAKRLARCLKLQDRTGYWRAPIYRGQGRRWLYVHRAVALAFLWPPPPGQELVCHIDGNSRNNRVENLRWGDYMDNAADRTQHEKERALWTSHGLVLPRYDPDTLGLDGDDYYGAIWALAQQARKEAR